MQYQLAKIRLLQEQYYSYIDAVKGVLKKYPPLRNATPAVDDTSDEEFELDSFLVIDRSPSYLKDSTYSYLKTQQMDALLNRINPYEWDNYTDQVLMGVDKKAETSQSSPSRNAIRTGQRYQAPGWSRKKARKETSTGITFALPIERSRFWVSSLYGPRKNRGFHYGLDMAAHRGTPAKAVAAGKVEQAAFVSGYGNVVVVGHDAVYKSRYAHLDKITVRKGDLVKQGDCVGKVGDTGFTLKTGKDASHLHLELCENGKQVNPLYLLPI